MEKLKILSNNHFFHDRIEAARLLSREIEKYRTNSIILGVSSGGVIIAKEISKSLGIPMDMMFSKKITTPYDTEMTIGALNENGQTFINRSAFDHLHVPDQYLENEKNNNREKLFKKAALLRKIYPKIPLKGKIVIITDDGITTGSTIHAALYAAKAEDSKKLIVAIPVAPLEALLPLSEIADEVICLSASMELKAVSKFYKNFPKATDEEIIKIFKEEKHNSLNSWF